MKCNRTCRLLFLAVLLTGCQDKQQASRAEFQCRERPPAEESAPASSPPPSGMSYSGFTLGESATSTESRIADHKNWIGVRRSDCSGVWSVQAGTPLRNDGEAVCDVHGVSGCELVRATMKRTTTRTHELVDLVHVQRFERPGQPTQTVLSELQSNYGEPLWKQAIRRSSGWPEVIEETSFIWSTRKEGPPAQHVVARFEEEAINRLGTGDYLVVTLLHNDDDRVTYAITAKLRRVGAPGPTNGTAQ